MNLTTKLGWAAFLVSLSALGMSPAQARDNNQTHSTASIEERLEKIASVLKTTESQLPETSKVPDANEIAGTFVNRSGGGGFVNGGGHFNNRAWVNTRGFVNHNRGWLNRRS